MNRNLDEMIKSYSDELMSFARSHNSESLILKSQPPRPAEAEEKTVPEELQEDREEALPQSDAESRDGDTQEDDTAKTELKEIPAEEDMESFATFKSRAFTGFGAFPVENAKVALYRDDVLYAFLVTDKSGETPTIKIEAFPEENSLEPLSDEQRTDYTADVYADGFAEKKNLLVSAVGGSDVVLDVELTPESEVIN